MSKKLSYEHGVVSNISITCLLRITLEMALKKKLFFSLSQLKSAKIDICFFVLAEHYCTGSVFSLLKRKSADETVKFGRNSCPPILVMKKLGVFLFVSRIECFDHLHVKNLYW